MFSQFNVTEDGLQSWFNGPSYLAWSRSGDVKAYNGPLSPQFRQDQFNMLVAVTARARELGMTVVLPGFVGRVPAALAAVYPKANITTLPKWQGFNATYSGAAFLAPSDALYTEISSAYMEALFNNVGTDHMYYGGLTNGACGIARFGWRLCRLHESNCSRCP